MYMYMYAGSWLVEIASQHMCTHTCACTCTYMYMYSTCRCMGRYCFHNMVFVVGGGGSVLLDGREASGNGFSTACCLGMINSG